MIKNYKWFSQCLPAEIDASRFSRTEQNVAGTPHIFSPGVKLDFSVFQRRFDRYRLPLDRSPKPFDKFFPLPTQFSFHSMIRTSLSVPDLSRTYLHQHLCPRKFLPHLLQPPVSSFFPALFLSFPFLLPVLPFRPFLLSPLL